jgi:multiple sugar transport system substrate-binding protein
MSPLTKLLLAACFAVGIPAQGATEINYWLWDNNQLPSYQACADAFEKENPDIKVKITQTGWFDYWTALSTAFVSGTAPDVFWDHLSRYPEFIDNGLLVDLSPGSRGNAGNNQSLPLLTSHQSPLTSHPRKHP